jgi:hypothetical protein
MLHPMVDQLRFTRSEFLRAIKGVGEEDACRRFLPMNCLSWNVGHLAWQEQRYFLSYGQVRPLLMPEIDKQFAYGASASTPSLKEMLAAWRMITQAADPWLDTLTSTGLLEHVTRDGKPSDRTVGNLLQRVIYHYWYHLGENMAIRQMLGHARLGVFVGNIDDKAPYRPEYQG